LIPLSLRFRLKLNLDFGALPGGSGTVTDKDPDFTSVDALLLAARSSFHGDANVP
jgi:hypothetical protein